ncbi:hypothetical protein [Rickettsia felis]|uniref:hypothetical protein n=1 Tax=Rickettsia felis TaxID=42862 RepID=UPI001F48ED52|nr:hypothetical protein [Rickettsia felis]
MLNNFYCFYFFVSSSSLRATESVVAWIVIMSFPHRRESSNLKVIHNRFLKLKARFISLYPGFLLSQE